MRTAEISVTVMKTIYVDEATNIGMTADGNVYVLIGTEYVLMEDYVDRLDAEATKYITGNIEVPAENTE